MNAPQKPMDSGNMGGHRNLDLHLDLDWDWRTGPGSLGVDSSRSPVPLPMASPLANRLPLFDNEKATG